MTNVYIKLIERLSKALSDRDTDKLLEIYADTRIAEYCDEIFTNEAEYIKKIISRKVVL